MQFDMSLEDVELKPDIEEVETCVRTVSEFDIIPKDGIFLGLDISETSSGICIYENGVKSTYNASVDDILEGDFYEVRMRRQLKSDLTEVIEGKSFDLIVIEDAFQGINPQTTRKLYALNTAIDELILDGVCTCKKFLRVDNGTWKSWLFTIDENGVFKGLKDKPRIEKCLSLLGIHESGEGYQDRLDACGMLIGYFLKGKSLETTKTEDFNIHFALGDIRYAFEEDEDLIRLACRSERKSDDLCVVHCPIGQRQLNKKLVKTLLKDNSTKLVIIEGERILGAFGRDVGINATGKGYLGFWLCRSKYKKAIENIDKS